jgi:excisionase family DNA binding protein
VNIALTLTDEQLRELAVLVADELQARPDGTPGPPPDLLTIAQAAELAGVTPKTISNWLSAGRLSRHGVARRPLVSRAQLEALLAPEGPRRRTRIARRGAARGASTFTELARRD